MNKCMCGFIKYLAHCWGIIIFFQKKLIFSEDIHLEEFYSKYYNQKFLNIENCVLQLGLYIMTAIENKKVASKKKRKRNHSRKYLVS